MTHEQQNTEKENHTIEKLAHRLKLESYDVNKNFRKGASVNKELKIQR